MKLKYETEESKELLDKINEIKETLKAERNTKIAELKEYYKQLEKTQLADLRKERTKKLTKNYYDINFKVGDKQPTVRDTYAQKLYGKTYKECDKNEIKGVMAEYMKDYRKERAKRKAKWNN